MMWLDYGSSYVVGSICLAKNYLHSRPHSQSIAQSVSVVSFQRKGIEGLVPPIENNEERSIRYTVSMFSSPLTWFHKQAKLIRVQGQTSEVEEFDTGKAHYSRESWQCLGNHLLLMFPPFTFLVYLTKGPSPLLVYMNRSRGPLGVSGRTFSDKRLTYIYAIDDIGRNSHDQRATNIPN